MPRSTEEIAREIAHEFVNSFGVDECNGGRHSIWCLKHTDRITAALDAERREGDRLVEALTGLRELLSEPPVQALARYAQNMWIHAEEEVDKLKAAVHQRDQVIATIVTNLKNGRTPEQVVEWFDGEGQAMLAASPPPPGADATGEEGA